MIRLSEHPRQSLALGAFVLVVIGALLPAARLAGCAVTGRDGWTLELPEYRGISPEELRKAIRAQTWCVPVEVGYVNLGYAPEGQIVEPTGGGRTWVAWGDEIKVWVEGSSAQATDPCRPIGATEFGRNECPGAISVLPDAGCRTLSTQPEGWPKARVKAVCTGVPQLDPFALPGGEGQAP